ncbi:MAG: methionine adenosyltransferase [Armatimonadota bacterium]
MAEGTYHLTSESVTEGHPDKMADQISDAILDALLEQDENSRVACETLVTTGIVFVAGEITTDAYADIPSIIRETVGDIGYTRAKFGFDYETVGVMTAIQEQSPDISLGVDVGGAGDQGMMFGYATNETEEYMPLPIMLSHKLAKQLAHVRKTNEVEYLRPDGKSQVTVEYQDGKPVRVAKVLIAAQHAPNVSQKDIYDDMAERVVHPIIPSELRGENMEILVNRTGSFSIGGPQADTGLTGRKIIVDTYGGLARHGGGCFSGKDPTKVDRSASYMARYVAKNVVAAGLADRCELQLSYAIGDVAPFSLSVSCFGTEKMPQPEIEKLVREEFDLSPAGMIEYLDLRRPIYKSTAAYGHFGWSYPERKWEETDMADALRKAAGI